MGGREILGYSFRRWRQAKGSTGRVVALVAWYAAGYFATRRRNPSRSSALIRARAWMPSPSLGKVFVCCAVQYPPKATSNFRNAFETSSIETGALRKDRSIPDSSSQFKIWVWMANPWVRVDWAEGRWLPLVERMWKGLRVRFWIRLP